MKNKSGTGLIPWALLCGVQAAFFVASLAQGSGEEPKLFPPNSPEHQALSAATPYLGDDDFYLRNDYWQGKITADSGTAMRLQFFKGNTYRLFLGATKDELPENAKLHLHIFDKNSKEVASSTSKAGESAAVLSQKIRKTGLYLILMRIEVPEGTGDGLSIPCVLFYGWK